MGTTGFNDTGRVFARFEYGRALRDNFGFFGTIVGGTMRARVCALTINDFLYSYIKAGIGTSGGDA